LQWLQAVHGAQAVLQSPMVAWNAAYNVVATASLKLYGIHHMQNHLKSITTRRSEGQQSNVTDECGI
jgi:hypothetical protein